MHVRVKLYLKSSNHHSQPFIHGTYDHIAGYDVGDGDGGGGSGGGDDGIRMENESGHTVG